MREKIGIMFEPHFLALHLTAVHGAICGQFAAPRLEFMAPPLANSICILAPVLVDLHGQFTFWNNELSAVVTSITVDW